ncbi:hypothetical protein RCL1_000255 [Eukaryota sp. TZLM3-RCL]
MQYYHSPITFDELSSCALQRVVDNLFISLRDASSAFPQENSAAAKIQSCWRCRSQRRIFIRLRDNTILLQSYIRGFLGRSYFRKLHQEHIDKSHQELLNRCATLVQRLFRGFYSRKYKGDYYKTKSYLETITRENSKVREELLYIESHTKEVVNEEKRVRELEEFSSSAAQCHHLLSTAAISGVFSTPHFPVPTAYGVPLEEAITYCSQESVEQHKKTQKLKFTAQPPPTVRRIVSEQPQGPFMSKPVVEYMKTKQVEPTLRTVEKYRAEDRSAIDSLVNKKFIQQVHGKLFTSVSKPAPLSHPMSLRCSEQYTKPFSIGESMDRNKGKNFRLGTRYESFDKHAELKFRTTLR